MTYLAAYLAFAAVFIICWTRGLPPRENMSRALDRELRRRAMGDQPRIPADFAAFHAPDYAEEGQHNHG